MTVLGTYASAYPGPCVQAGVAEADHVGHWGCTTAVLMGNLKIAVRFHATAPAWHAETLEIQPHGRKLKGANLPSLY